MNFVGQRILAPLTKGGTLPFRRLCVEFGAEVTLSEMAYARQIKRRTRAEMALLKSHESEAAFGVQLAAGTVDDAVHAAQLAVERGAQFVDLNAGCPIHDTVKRGMGATLLRRTKSLLEISTAMVEALEVPVTVKLRSGWNEKDVVAVDLARQLEGVGVRAITLHARSREQRYTKAADWSLVAEVVAACSIPIIGNGDLLTWYEARDRQAQSGCASVMLARGALVKPWLFREIAEQRSWEPTPEERVGVYFRLVECMKEHFGADARGRKRAMRFLPWHFGFFCRYRPLPAEAYEAASREHPLMHLRETTDAGASPLEQLLRNGQEDVHGRIADTLWGAETVEAAVAALAELAVDLPEPAADGGLGDVAVAHG